MGINKLTINNLVRKYGVFQFIVEVAPFDKSSLHEIHNSNIFNFVLQRFKSVLDNDSLKTIEVQTDSKNFLVGPQQSQEKSHSRVA